MNTTPSRAETEALVRATMQPIRDDQIHPLGSLKARQKRIRDIHFALNADDIPEPQLQDLNDEQLTALRLALEGHGLYITGAAGMSFTALIHPSSRSQERGRRISSPRFMKPLCSNTGIVLP